MKRLKTFFMAAKNRLRNYCHCFGYFRGPIYFFLERVFPLDLQFTANSPDGKELRLRSKSTDAAAYVQIFVSREYEFSLAVYPKIIVDAGANTGFSAIFFSIRYPNSKIIALEPETKNYELLCSNTAAYPNVFPLRKALWSKNQILGVLDVNKGRWGFQVHEKESVNRGRYLESVEGITIDQIMRDFAIDYIDLLKMDIEGSEKCIFDNSDDWISSIGAIAVELHEWLNPGCRESFHMVLNKFEHVIRRGEKYVLFKEDHWPRDAAMV